MKPQTIMVAAMIAAAPFLSACSTSAFKASEYAKYELGDIVRAESATILSQRAVKITNLRGNGGRTNRRNGINYIIKLDRTGETMSVTQTDDVSIATGASAWVEFGDRIRLAPRT